MLMFIIVEAGGGGILSTSLDVCNFPLKMAKKEMKAIQSGQLMASQVMVLIR